MNQGFTLIELLVVVLIIGILSAVALPQYQTAVERSRAAEALTQISAIADSLERYHAQHDAWPNTGSFNKLDVDIPTIKLENGHTVHGGKYFTVNFGNDGEVSFCYVAASRRKSNPTYELQIKITVQSDGSYARTRSCIPSPTNNAEAMDYCNAISGGHPDDF